MHRSTAVRLAAAIALLAATACGGSQDGAGGDLAAAAKAKGGKPGSGGGTTAGGVTGVVKDIATGTPLSGVTISDGTNAATTSSTGAYALSGTAAGTATLTATAQGYLTTSQLASVSSSGTATVNWALTKGYGNQKIPAAGMSYVVLAWNDLGMHCDQDDYSYFMVLPPYNTLHAQVVRRGGDLPTGVTVSYAFPKKTDSTLHTNFWQYAGQYGYGTTPNVGITGTKLSGVMQADPNGHGFVAQGIPITPYDDDGTWDPYGTATLTVKDASGNVLQTTKVVAPVSTEMMCSNCHGTTDPQLDILQKHDALSGTSLAADHAAGKVHACSECHQDNAIGAPGKPGVESLSLAMHDFHKDKMATTSAAVATTPDCYNCHPGSKTQCLRGIMARAGKSCHDCHGDMNAMASGLLAGREPWLQEPRCGTCHDAKHAENAGTLYRNSVLQNSPTSDMNGRYYCEACHGGPHAELATANSADPTIPMQFQGDNYWIWSCTVCHTSQPQSSMHR